MGHIRPVGRSLKIAVLEFPKVKCEQDKSLVRVCNEGENTF